MAGAVKKVPARFYRTGDGKEPAREWIMGLGSDDRKVIGRDILKVEFGWPIGLPVCRPLTNGLWEVRSNLSQGRIARVIFCIVGGSMVLLHGFIKKTQKAPPHDLDLALKRKKDIET